MTKRHPADEAEQPESPKTMTLGSAISEPPASGTQSKSKRRSSGSWTVASEFVHNGFKYRVLRRPLAPDESQKLTSREEEALMHAAHGLSNKRIAQSLGVSPSTVGVLLFRAAAKLGARSRTDLLLAFERIKSSRSP